MWSADVTSAAPGQQYKYYITYSGGNVWKHDPRARLVTYSGSSAGANDIIYDPAAFNWSSDNFTTPALGNMVVYELHIGTFPSSSIPSKFVAATNKLDYLKQMGVNVVEVMPIAEFPGDNSWGYNPADPYAIENAGYGGADGFKTFVKACHQHGIAVLVDVVHNHYGPTDLDLWDFDGWDGGVNGGGIYFYQDNYLCCTSYGSRPNYSRQPVRDYIQDNFTMFLDEYHVDGFRWDTPGLMMDAYGYGTINDAVTLIQQINTMIHNNYPGKVSIAEDRSGYGFDSTWDLGFPGTMTSQLAQTSDASRDMNTVASEIYGSGAAFGRVVFLESHDVVGDLNGGIRLPMAIDGAIPDSYWARKRDTLGAAIVFTARGVPMIFQGQEMLETNAFSSSLAVAWNKTNTYSGIVRAYHDLIHLRRNTDGVSPGLEGDQCNVYLVDNANKLVAYRRWQNGADTQDVVVIANFANATRNNYAVSFPRAGNWYVHFNSDSTDYGSDYGNIGSSVVTASGSSPTGNITVGPYSALILSQMPPTPPLSITQTNNALTVSWSASPPGWLLDSSPYLTGNPPVWNQVSTAQYQTNGATVFINVNSPTSNVFYRLRKP